MWARLIEILLGLWLMASPFVFRSGGSLTNDVLCGLSVVILGFLSFWNRTAQAHYLSLLVAGWLIGFGYLAGYPAPVSAQNHIIAGLLLGMFAIIPNDVNELPAAWRRFYADKAGLGVRHTRRNDPMELRSQATKAGSKGEN